MPQPPNKDLPALDAFDPQSYLGTVAPVVIGAIDDAYRDGVLANLTTALAMAKVVFAVDLDADSCEFAPVFTPVTVDASLKSGSKSGPENEYESVPRNTLKNVPQDPLQDEAPVPESSAYER